MNAPLGRTPEKMGRCQCRCSKAHPIATPVDLGGQCELDAVRLVTVRPRLDQLSRTDGAANFRAMQQGAQIAMCEPCAEHAEQRTEDAR